MYCMKPLVTVSTETKWCMKKLSTFRHGTQPVCKVSDLYSGYEIRSDTQVATLATNWFMLVANSDFKLPYYI